MSGPARIVLLIPLLPDFIPPSQLLAQAFAPDIFESDHFPVVWTPTSSQKARRSALLASFRGGLAGSAGFPRGSGTPVSEKTH